MKQHKLFPPPQFIISLSKKNGTYTFFQLSLITTLPFGLEKLGSKEKLKVGQDGGENEKKEKGVKVKLSVFHKPKQIFLLFRRRLIEMEIMPHCLCRKRGSLKKGSTLRCSRFSLIVFVCCFLRFLHVFVAIM